MGWACQALVTGFTDVEAAQPQLAQAQAELDAAIIASPGLNTDVVAGLVPWLGARIAAGQGDITAALDGTDAFLASAVATDYYTTGATRAAKHAAACQILLGDPASAIQTIEWLESFEVSVITADEVRALAHLARGELADAKDLICVHARRGLTGRLTGEACDSALLLAALAHAEGDDEIAKDLLRHMGMGLEPATVTYSRQLAAELGVAAEHAELQRLAWTYGPASAEGQSGTRLAAAAVSKEFARRGWT